jgi:hypothetical protein
MSGGIYLEREVHIFGRHSMPDAQECSTSLREVNLCCMKCKKSYRMTYTEIGDPGIIAFRNVGFTCSRCKRKKRIKTITEGALLRNVTMWNSVYI